MHAHFVHPTPLLYYMSQFRRFGHNKSEQEEEFPDDSPQDSITPQITEGQRLWVTVSGSENLDKNDRTDEKNLQDFSPQDWTTVSGAENDHHREEKEDFQDNSPPQDFVPQRWERKREEEDVNDDSTQEFIPQTWKPKLETWDSETHTLESNEWVTVTRSAKPSVEAETTSHEDDRPLHQQEELGHAAGHDNRQSRVRSKRYADLGNHSKTRVERGYEGRTLSSTHNRKYDQIKGHRGEKHQGATYRSTQKHKYVWKESSRDTATKYGPKEASEKYTIKHKYGRKNDPHDQASKHQQTGVQSAFDKDGLTSKWRYDQKKGHHDHNDADHKDGYEYYSKLGSSLGENHHSATYRSTYKHGQKNYRHDHAAKFSTFGGSKEYHHDLRTHGDYQLKEEKQNNRRKYKVLKRRQDWHKITKSSYHADHKNKMDLHAKKHKSGKRH